MHHAVVSDIEILSTNPRPLGVLPASPLAAPRLSPRPVDVPGVAAVSVDLAGTLTSVECEEILAKYGNPRLVRHHLAVTKSQG